MIYTTSLTERTPIVIQLLSEISNRIVGVEITKHCFPSDVGLTNIVVILPPSSSPLIGRTTV